MQSNRERASKGVSSSYPQSKTISDIKEAGNSTNRKKVPLEMKKRVHRRSESSKRLNAPKMDVAKAKSALGVRRRRSEAVVRNVQEPLKKRSKVLSFDNVHELQLKEKK